jgi:hypothetical protein
MLVEHRSSKGLAVDHKEQHHQQHLHEREEEKKHQHHHELEQEKQPRTIHPGWFAAVGIALIIGVLMVWIFVW